MPRQNKKKTKTKLPRNKDVRGKKRKQIKSSLELKFA